MNKRQQRAFKRAVLKNTEWLGKTMTKKGEVEIGVNGDFEVIKGFNFIIINDKKSTYHFRIPC